MRFFPCIFVTTVLSLASITAQAQGGRVGLPSGPSCNSMAIGQNSSLNGFVPFPANDPWRTSVTYAPVDGNSDAIIATIGASIGMHADFGAGQYNGGSVGIPYQVVSRVPAAPVTYTAYGDESDQGPFTIPANALIEGYPNVDPYADNHVLVLNRDTCFLYELYGASVDGSGNWSAQSGVIWDMQNNNRRPLTWGSADAAGLPIFPGLARYDEVAAGVIRHALRFTLKHSRAAFVAPATHYAPNNSYQYQAPMGMRMRLRASFDISNFPPQSRVILQALKTYGMIMADNGASMFLSGSPNDHWDNTDLQSLRGVKASDFEVLQETPLSTPSTIATGAAPVISSFTATKSPFNNGAYNLIWHATGASYYVVDPAPGPVRSTSYYVQPKVTTTYTLYATNQFGQTTATVTVNVP